jgi:antitoxin HigA-1
MRLPRGSPREEHRISVPNTRRLGRRPVNPGEVLREEFLPEYGLTAAQLAAALGVSRPSTSCYASAAR